MRTRQENLNILKSYHPDDLIAIYDIFSSVLKHKGYNDKPSFEILMDSLELDKSAIHRWLRTLRDPNPGQFKAAGTGEYNGRLTAEQVSKNNDLKRKPKDKLCEFMLKLCEKINWEINVYTGDTWPLEEKKFLSTQYISYYWNEKADRTERTVKKGSVIIDYILTPDDKIEIFDFRLRLLLSKKDIERFSILKSFRISQVEDILYVYMEDPETRSLHINLTLSFNANSFPNKIITGTYSTVRRGNRKLPVAGRVLLSERPEGLTDRGIISGSIPPEIYSYLYRSRIYGEDKILQSVGQLPSTDEIKALQPYAGQYYCTYFRKSKGPTEQGDQVEKFLFEVSENGEASMTVVKDEGYVIYLGRMRALRSKQFALIAYMDFMPQDNTYRFTIYFDKRFKKNTKTLFATYAGLERDHPDIPTAGRMVLRQLDKKVSEREFPSKVKAIPVDKIEEWTAEDPLNKEDIKFLSGFYGYDYLESLAPVNTAQKEELKDFAYEGTYFVYSLSTMQHAIHKVPLAIDGQGLVKMKTRNEKSLACHKGRATAGTNRFSIYMEREDSPNDHFHFIFNKPGVPGKFKHIFGISSKIDTQNSPAGRLEVLVRDKFNLADTVSQSFDIGSESYWAENKATRGLLEYLTGKYNRYVVAKSKPDDSFKRTNQKFYFYAGCYLCANFEQNLNPEKIDEALRLLYQAYLHGFGRNQTDRELLKKEMGSSFSKVLEEPEVSRPNSSSLDDLNFKDIFNLILNQKK
ncbi:hypothetical protein [Pedobacter sp. Leaf176]|uniref:hypothetical protein n=1 Tax=Pedobacter sp. Leaf176 TaxID=1736286 RepID=UPI0006F5D4A6|nr:hypothetical protein [Pedobacter sp. Leaf176]KQR70155.1 hypothetical protein ASF92_09140 [Pedobacter sp. Leaf176]